MSDLSPALMADLAFAVSRYGLTVTDVPRDHQGKTITDRLSMLLDGGESYCHGSFRKTDLRSEHASVWSLFPENPATIQAQHQLIDEVGELLEQERSFREPPLTCIVKGSELPRPEHTAALEALLAYIDGYGDAPEIVRTAWSDTELFDQAAAVIPGLRDAEQAVATRERLVAELAEGSVPPASAVYVRRALDSDADGLRNADITLAGYRVSTARLRDAVELTLEGLRPHLRAAERIRKVRDDLDLIDGALHWPGPWRTAPHLREMAESRLG